jgi:hypothetical protein
MKQRPAYSTTFAKAAAWRVQRHHLGRRAPAGAMLAVASRICGLHAQVLSTAELALWARVEDLPRRWVTRALWEERTLVKTWAMRGTLHLLPASELPEWHAALGTSRRYRSAVGWQRFLGISLEDLTVSHEPSERRSIAASSRARSCWRKSAESWSAPNLRFSNS